MKKTPTFEEALVSLENVVKRLEEEEIPLEEAMKLFEQGVKEATFCQKTLSRVEQKVQKLMRTNDGQFRLTDLEDE